MEAYDIKEIANCLDKVGDNLLGAYQFGSTVEGKGMPGDLDMLLVVRDKSAELKRQLEECMRDLPGGLCHQIDYSVRPEGSWSVDFLVLPEGSGFLASESGGILVGLSGFVLNPYRKIIGDLEPVELLGLPTNEYSLKERIEIFLKCNWGVNHILARLWPVLYCNCASVDIRRLAKFFLADLLWVYSARMEKDTQLVIDGLGEHLEGEALDSVTELWEHSARDEFNDVFDAELNDQMTIRMYEAVGRVKGILKKQK